MPTIPIVDPVVPGTSGGSFARATPQLLTPTQQRPVRANPNMYEGVNAANQQIAGAVSNFGRDMNELEMRKVDLQTRVKHATDSAYITRAQTAMEAANLEFQNWTKTNPDPSAWGEELNFRISDTKKKVEEGAKALSPMAQQRLGLVINDWEIGTQKRVQLQATEHSIQIAQASFNDYVQMATQNNDLDAVEIKVAEGVRDGIYNPKTAQSIVARARQNVTMNVANQLIELDPFEAERQLADKDEAGAHRYFPEMNATMRTTLQFRANKAAAQARSNTMREWASMVRDAQDGRGQMPDKLGILEEAKKQGISPKWVDNLFKVPTATNPDEFAATYSAISTYDVDQDPTGRRMGELVQQIETFKGPALSRLNSLLEKKLNPEDPLNAPVAKFGVQSIKEMFEIGGYGKFKEPAKLDPTTGERIPGAELPGAKMKAEVIMGRNMDLFHERLKKNPDTTYEQAQKYINSLNAQHATNNASRLIINGGAFGIPKQ